MKSNQYAGGWNLKGKKTKVLPCQCCEVFDAREELKLKQENEEILEEIKQYGTVKFQS